MKRNLALLLILIAGCSKKESPAPTPVVVPLRNNAVQYQSADLTDNQFGISVRPVFTAKFDTKISQSTANAAVSINTASGAIVPVTISFTQGDSAMIITPNSPLAYLSKYTLNIATTLKSASGGNLTGSVSRLFTTVLDSSRKFPAITDEALLDKVQQQTFRYFWDFGHPVSGLARERNTSGDVVTSGGSGFGIMAIIAAVNRGFITRAQALTRLQTIASFLKNTAVKHHGAFPHWLNGATGATVAFSTKDNGADLVETSYLAMGLLTARQFFNGADAAETTLRADINSICDNIEWDWFRRGGQDVLYWHWSPTYAWDMNMQIKGWNECLITYIIAASSSTHGIPPSVYTNGWASNGSSAYLNGQNYLGFQLPYGGAYGGPLFFSHYTFMGVNPNGLRDAYGNIQTQVISHTKINHQHCINNATLYYGYSDSCWGLTACDVPGGYQACSPTSDIGVIAPTAALSSMPYDPEASMKALKFFYYVLGDQIWKDYGFVDAFSLKQAWFANSFIAIDQGPIIVMIENYRSGLLWNLFTSCPEIKTGMRNLGFTAPYL